MPFTSVSRLQHTLCHSVFHRLEYSMDRKISLTKHHKLNPKLPTQFSDLTYMYPYIKHTFPLICDMGIYQTVSPKHLIHWWDPTTSPHNPKNAQVPINWWLLPPLAHAALIANLYPGRKPCMTWLPSRSRSCGGNSLELAQHSAEQPGEDVPNCSSTKETSLFIKD